MSTRFTPQGLVHEHSEDCSHALDGPFDPLRDAVRQVLIEHAVDAKENQGLHGWRCQYPDSYGPCTCFEELVSALTDVISTF